MVYQIWAGGLVSLVNFGLHAVITGIVVVAARHTAAATDDLHVFARVSALLMVTMVALMTAHNVETLPARYQDMISVSKPYTAVDVERAVKQLALRKPTLRAG